jgi:hypothetical protein
VCFIGVPKKKTAGVAGGSSRVRCVVSGYAQISLPPAALENQKVPKKKPRTGCMGSI